MPQAEKNLAEKNITKITPHIKSCVKMKYKKSPKANVVKPRKTSCNFLWARNFLRLSYIFIAVKIRHDPDALKKQRNLKIKTTKLYYDTMAGDLGGDVNPLEIF